MSVFTPKRLFLCIVAVFAGTAAFAAHPSPRTLARMAYDAENNVAVLFGGRGNLDRGGTGVAHGSNETWLFSGSTWAQRFPATTPPGRSTHAMAYDSREGRVVMFGGRQEPIDNRANPILYNDLWAYENDDWHRIDGSSSQAPTEREFAAMAFDHERNRLVVYGGYVIGGRNNREEVPIFDTWEFSGGNWTRTTVDAPKVVKPALAYDRVSKQVFMIGNSETPTGAPVMFRYDGDGHSWQQVNAPKLPGCVTEGHLVFQPTNQRLLFIGGACGVNTPTGEEVWEFDGTTWTKLTTTFATKTLGQAVTYDEARTNVLFFGGTTLSNIPIAFTITYDRGRWAGAEAFRRPPPRSQMVFVTDPVRNVITLLGGLSESGGTEFLSDTWSFRGGSWFASPDAANGPVGCAYPLGAYDTDRQRLVVSCGGPSVWEFDGEKWKEFAPADPKPDSRRFAAVAYDQKLKKTILFGGYLNDSFRNDTWTWDGTKWAEIKVEKDHRPPHRGSMAMWYDPLQQKTILYSGIGRPNINTSVVRYTDMWTFDGTRWSKLEVPQTPGARLRPLVAVNPTTNKVLLFGGLRFEQIDENSSRQFYTNDTWEWDGSTSKWTLITTTTAPPVRQNGGLAWDPGTNRMTMFGGNALGFYLSDAWTFTGTDWEPYLRSTAGRGRSVRK